jgi:hypothetical protein
MEARRVTRETIRDGLRSLEQAEPEEQWVMLCFLGGRDVEVDSAEANAAFRRAELLLATGGDPRRRLELSSRAVSSVADDLDTPTRRQQLTAGLAALQAETVDPSRAADSVGRLLADSDLAWRCLAAALLAEELGSVDDD